MITDLITNKDFLRHVPDGASDGVVAIAGLLFIIKRLNEKNKSITVPNNVVYAYAEVRRDFTITELGYVGEIWARICGVYEESTPYKVHEEKGAELIATLDRLLAEKLKEKYLSDVTLH
jgi:hypothetical protein